MTPMWIDILRQFIDDSQSLTFPYLIMYQVRCIFLITKKKDNKEKSIGIKNWLLFFWFFRLSSWLVVLFKELTTEIFSRAFFHFVKTFITCTVMGRCSDINNTSDFGKSIAILSIEWLIWQLLTFVPRVTFLLTVTIKHKYMYNTMTTGIFSIHIWFNWLLPFSYPALMDSVTYLNWYASLNR